MTKERKLKQALEWLVEEVKAATIRTSDNRRYAAYIEDYPLDDLDDALTNAIGVLKRRQLSHK